MYKILLIIKFLTAIKCIIIERKIDIKLVYQTFYCENKNARSTFAINLIFER